MILKTQETVHSNIYTKLFQDWDLGTWANVLEDVGFIFAIISFIIALKIKSEIKKLKTDLIFDKRIKKHTTNLGILLQK